MRRGSPEWEHGKRVASWLALRPTEDIVHMLKTWCTHVDYLDLCMLSKPVQVRYLLKHWPMKVREAYYICGGR